MRTSLDLELDLQATRTWHSQLTQEISVLKELKEQLEQAKSHGEKELPQGLREDERFRLLLRMLEKRVSAARKAGAGRAWRRSERRSAAARERGPSFERVLQPWGPRRVWIPRSHQQRCPGTSLPSKLFKSCAGPHHSPFIKHWYLIGAGARASTVNLEQ